MWNLDYKELYELSLNHPERYWDEVAKDVVWSKQYTSVLADKDTTSPRWYVGGEINMSYNCLDKQVEDGYGDEVIVIHDSPITGSVTRLTYRELLASVELFAGVLSKRCGMVTGDRVMLSFPMIPQCLIAMLACTRIGVIYTTIFEGFALNEYAARIRYFEPKVIISTNVGLVEPETVINYKEKMDAAIELSGFAPEYCIIYNRPNSQTAQLKEGRDLDWQHEIINATPQRAIPQNSDHPLYVIFTSGTTGEPKGLVRPTGGAVVATKYDMKRALGLKPGEVWWAMSDFSWILGQNAMSYGPLMSRNPTIIYEGKPTKPSECSQIIRILNQHKVSSFFTIPTVIKVIRKSCDKKDLELTYTNLKTIHLGGELIEASLSEWTSNKFKCPVYNAWGQTELSQGGIMSALGFLGSEKCLLDNNIGLLLPGFRALIVDPHTGHEVPNGTVGRFLLKMPLVPAALSTLYKDHSRFVKTYLSKYPGYYDTMDSAVITEDGLLKLVGRDDDIIHVGAVRISGSAVEEACLKNEDVDEAVVVALEDQTKGFVPFAFLITKENCALNDSDIIMSTVKLVLQCVGDVACFSHAVVVPAFPKNTSGKTPRKSLADMLNGKQYKVPATVENPQIYAIIHGILVGAGFKATLPTAI